MSKEKRPAPSFSWENLSAAELFDRMRTLAKSRDIVERLPTLWIAAAFAERLEQGSNAQIADLLCKVQERMSVFDAEYSVCEFAKLRLLKSLARTSMDSWRVSRDAGLELLNAEAALFQSRIPHMLLPFQKDRFSSNVFYVPTTRDARACLLRRGFHSSPQSGSLLLDLQTNRQIRLVEAEPQATRDA
jgi:hypothetical protein